MNLSTLDKKMNKDLFRHLGERIVYQDKSGSQKYCRVIILKNIKQVPNGYTSHVPTQQTEVIFRNKDIEQIRQGDLIISKTHNYTVDHLIENDGSISHAVIR